MPRSRDADPRAEGAASSEGTTRHGSSPADVLDRFSPATGAWFRGAFEGPTAAQVGAWEAVSDGRDALVVAPTGSGKTLAAFLWSLDRIAAAPVPKRPQERCRVVYVSPLKALAVDVERNLRAPLTGIRQAAARLGLPEPNVTVAVRSGDTTPEERRAFSRRPSDILITTPESLFLLLTSQARAALEGVETVIVDEVHAVAGTKRGAHLALSLERLDALLQRRAQRIGLSATVRPVEEVARFLGGTRIPAIVRPPSAKVVELEVVVPVEDMADPGATPAARSDPRPVGPRGRGTRPPRVGRLGAPDLLDADLLDGERTDPERTDPERTDPERTDTDLPDPDRLAPDRLDRLDRGGGTADDDVASLLGVGFDGTAAGNAHTPSIWPHVEERIVDLVQAHRSTLVFANSRRLAERLTARLNEIAWERARGEDLPEAGGQRPAELMAQAGSTRGAPPEVEIARAHHGSVSREQRALTEEALKAGRLPAVVATSSLELGIDMGAVDLVVQVESPPSVASGLQRVGRAGHQVGAVSKGVIFPKYRGDLVQTAVVAERMREGQIEALRIPRNPLDVLAQQVVAMCAMDTWDVEELLELVRRAAPFAELPRSAYESVLDMLAGRYPSDEFAELRPRIVWDRTTGTLTGRPGAQRLAVTSGGTIPDRGLFGVFLASGEGSRRVGELDEEMVYESRVGDVFTLGSSSWRIEDITHDRVLVTPAPGIPGKLPFWHGDALGRPVELGRALGAFVRELGRLDRGAALTRVRAAGLDDLAAGNLLAYLDEQRDATGTLPDDRTIVVERFRDELGDWRVCVHSPFGAQVHAPWALAIAARMRERTGLDVQVMHADDGIVLRLPDVDVLPRSHGGGAAADPAAGAAAGAEAAILAADDVEPLVTAEVGSSALFAARFRECAARALLLPRRDPGRRTPLWAQRQRSAQLLSVASSYGSFPIVLEAVRECLQDVFDVPGLVDLMRRIESREVRVVEVETAAPSPFARSLLFGYVAQYLYEGDSPLAERRAQALALDSTLLAELLGQAELRELLDIEVVARLDLELQWLPPERHARTLEATADLLRALGPLTTDEVVERGGEPGWLVELEGQRRLIRTRIHGAEHWAAIEDAGRLRDALGAPLPVGVPEAFLELTADPLADLVSRYARTHGPFQAADVATRFGIGVAVSHDTLRRLAAAGRVVEGEFRPGASGSEWCDAGVLRTLRRRSLAALRREVEPVPPRALARFLPAWHGIGSPSRGAEGLYRALQQLQGAALPASALESLVLPIRVADYEPATLDELCASGEVLWSGAGSLPGHDGWVALHLAENAALTVLPPVPEAVSSPLHEAVLDALSRGGGWFFRQLSDAVSAASPEPVPDGELAAALWDLVWGGHVTNDTLAPVRALVGASPSPRRSRRAGRPGRPNLRAPVLRTRPLGTTRATPPTVAGRWSQLPARESDTTLRATAAAELLLDRHGVITRGAALVERVEGGFAGIYRVLAAFEEAGRARRGYFVEGLGAAQFALPGAVDRMRALQAEAERAEASTLTWTGAGERLTVPDWAAGGVRPRQPRPAGPTTVVLAATDPANPYGAALSWPERSVGSGTAAAEASAGHRAGRKAGAVVVLVDGELVVYVERGGRSLLTWSEDPATLQAAADALALAVRDGALGRLTLERADGAALLGSRGGPVTDALTGAGFLVTPRGLRLRT